MNRGVCRPFCLLDSHHAAARTVGSNNIQAAILGAGALGLTIISINSFVLKLIVLILIISECGLSFLFEFLSNFFSEISAGELLVING